LLENINFSDLIPEGERLYSVEQLWRGVTVYTAFALGGSVLNHYHERDRMKLSRGMLHLTDERVQAL